MRRAGIRGRAAWVRAVCLRSEGVLIVEAVRKARRDTDCGTRKSHSWHTGREGRRIGTLPGFMAGGGRAGVEALCRCRLRLTLSPSPSPEQ